MIWPYTPWSRPVRGSAELDRWLPGGARRLEHHAITLPGSAAEAMAAIQGLTIRELPAVRALFALRRLPFRPDMTLREFFSTPPFVLLSDEAREVVFAIGVPVEQCAGADADAFLRVAERRAFVAIGTFRAEPLEPGRARLWTETWVSTTGPAATVAFGAYWLVVGPFSAWIRRLFLQGARARVLAAARAPAAR